MKQEQREALERRSSPMFTIRDGNAPFSDDPSDIAERMHEAIRYIEFGEPYMTRTCLPWWEKEAIARIKAQTAARPVVEPDEKTEPELWRSKWVAEAMAIVPHMHTETHLARSAVNVLLTCARLRTALDSGNTHMASALSMLLLCEVFMGGYMSDAELMRSALLTAEEERRQRVANTIGKNHADLEQLRRACVQKARVMWEADPTLRMIEVPKTCREAILNVLAKHPEKLPSMKAKDVPGEDAIKTWLREAGAAGALQIPDAAQKPGRPKKLQARADK